MTADDFLANGLSCVRKSTVSPKSAGSPSSQKLSRPAATTPGKMEEGDSLEQQSQARRWIAPSGLPRHIAVASEEELEEIVNSPSTSPSSCQQISPLSTSSSSRQSPSAKRFSKPFSEMVSSGKHEPEETMLSSVAPVVDRRDSGGSLGLKDVIVGPMLSFGRTGRVWSGLNKRTGSAVAVKEISEEHVDAGEAELLVLEVNGHRDLMILMEQMPGLSLHCALQQFGPLDSNTTGRYTRQVLLGLKSLHDLGVCHRDLKSSNVLLGSCGECRLADFGCSRTAGTMDASQLHTVCGTPAWMAPEVLLGGGYSFPADIWALGCLVLEMATGLAPWASCSFDNEVVAMMRIASGDDTPLDVLPPDCSLSSSCKEFVRMCLQREPQKRSEVGELLLHSFVAYVDDDTVATSTGAVPHWDFVWDSGDFDSSIVKDEYS